MKMISWNVRGINAPNKRGRIKSRLDSSKDDIFLLQETKLSHKMYHKIVAKWTQFGSPHMQGVGASGGLLTLWNPKKVQVHLLEQDHN